MGLGSSGRGDVLWDVDVPQRPVGTPGVRMAAFADRGVTPSELRLIPHPSATLVLVLGGTIRVEDAHGRRREGSFVTGPGFADALRVVRVDAFDCLQVRLEPVAAAAVLGAGLAELDGEVVTLDELWGPDAARMTERLRVLSSRGELFAAADALLAERVGEHARSGPEVTWAWRRIAASRGDIRVERLAAELGWSRKRLWSRFRAQLGLTPKRAARLVRFDHAVHRLVAGDDVARVAADGGYADQSHLHRDVRDLTGLTPATVVGEPFLAVDDVAWGWPSRAGRARA
jgi:AraC-like DNA-binding protein